MKKSTYRFRETEIPDGNWTRTVVVDDGKLYFGSNGFTKKRLRMALKKRHGRFLCSYSYTWKLNRSGSLTFTRKNDYNEVFTNTLPKRLVDRIRKWARSR